MAEPRAANDTASGIDDSVKAASIAGKDEADDTPARLAERAEERAVVERLKLGDEDTFSALFSRYNSTLTRLARMFVSSPASAEEVVQETWLGVIRGIDRFEGRSLLRTWLFRILVNRAKTRAVREHRMLPFSALARNEADEPQVDADSFGENGHWMTPPRPFRDWGPEGEALRAEMRAFLQRAIEDLPPMQAAVVTLRDVEGWSSHEVCNELELSETNQRVLLHRARTKLRRAIESGPERN